jgi:hypothetical protein
MKHRIFMIPFPANGNGTRPSTDVTIRTPGSLYAVYRTYARTSRQNWTHFANSAITVDPSGTWCSISIVA